MRFLPMFFPAFFLIVVSTGQSYDFFCRHFAENGTDESRRENDENDDSDKDDVDFQTHD